MLIELNEDIMSRLSNTELQIVRFINDNENRLSELSIVDIGFDTFSSPSTVSRAIRKCGINGFNELRYRSTQKAKKKEVHDMGTVINKSLIEAQRVIEQISIHDILEIVKMINSASRIYILGRGLTEYVTEEFALKLQLLDYNAMPIRDPNIMRTKMEHMKSSEMLISFSLNGYTKEIIEATRAAHAAGAGIVTCCCNEDSPLIPISTYSILGYKDRSSAIQGYEVDSRLPLQIISRIIIEYIVSYQKDEN